MSTILKSLGNVREKVVCTDIPHYIFQVHSTVLKEEHSAFLQMCLPCVHSGGVQPVILHDRKTSRCVCLSGISSCRFNDARHSVSSGVNQLVLVTTAASEAHHSHNGSPWRRGNLLCFLDNSHKIRARPSSWLSNKLSINMSCWVLPPTLWSLRTPSFTIIWACKLACYYPGHQNDMARVSFYQLVNEHLDRLMKIKTYYNHNLSCGWRYSSQIALGGGGWC